MRWRTASASKRLIAAAGIFCLTFSVLLFSPAYSTETKVDVLICNPTSTAQLIIEEPPSDSIIHTPTVAVKGKAYSTSQLEFHVDGVYDKTIALAKGTVDFSTTITLSPGTHTITVTAIDICNQGNDTKHIVITYQPPPGPGPSPDPTPTPSPDAPTQPGAEADRPSQPGEGDAIPGRDTPTDLPGDGVDGEIDDGGIVFWPLSFAWDGSPLSFLVRLIIAFCGAFLLSLRPRHFARMFNQDIALVRWPYFVSAFLWLIGLLLILFAIFGI